MTDLGGQTATVGALELVTIGVDERNTALVARIGHANGFGVVRTAGVDTLVTAHHWLDTGVAADRTQCSLL